MKVLIADDAAIASKVLETSLVKWGYDIAPVNSLLCNYELMAGSQGSCPTFTKVL